MQLRDVLVELLDPLAVLSHGDLLRAELRGAVRPVADQPPLVLSLPPHLPRQPEVLLTQQLHPLTDISLPGSSPPLRLLEVPPELLQLCLELRDLLLLLVLQPLQLAGQQVLVLGERLHSQQH